MDQYLKILSTDAASDREWNANEKAGHGTQHEPIRISDDPVSIRLTWASNSGSPRKYIGTFQLYLKTLLEDDYITNDSKHGYLRVKFVNVHGEIRIAKGKRAQKYLVVGKF